MVTSQGKTPSTAQQSQAENAYEFNARNALALYGQFIDGIPNNTLMAISAQALPDAAKIALEASAAKLGYGKGAWAWVCCVGSDMPDGETPRLGAGDLRAIVECMDPISVVAADSTAASMLSKAYSTSMNIDSANRVACRTVVAFKDFPAMLASEDDKQKAWHALKRMKL